MSAAQDKVLDLIFGRWRSQILYAGVKLGVFEAVREGTKNAATIAQELGLSIGSYVLWARLIFFGKRTAGDFLSPRRVGTYFQTTLRRFGASPFWRKARSTMPCGSTCPI